MTKASELLSEEAWLCIPPILAHLVLPATDLYPVGHAHCSSTHTAPPSQW